MSFPKTLAAELSNLGCQKTGALAFDLPSQPGAVSWHLSFRTLGFAKNQIDGSLRYRHPTVTPFGWQCLSAHGGSHWREVVRTGDPAFALSGGIAIGVLAGWRTNFTLANDGLTPKESAKLVARDVEASVLPFASMHATDGQLLDLLLSDGEPFPWYRSNPLARLAEVAFLEAMLHRAPSQVSDLAQRHQAQAQDQLFGVSLEEYVSNVLSAARSDA